MASHPREGEAVLNAAYEALGRHYVTAIRHPQDGRTVARTWNGGRALRFTPAPTDWTIRPNPRSTTGMVACALATAYAHDTHPELEVGVIEYANLAYPATTDPDDAMATYRRNQMEQLPADVLALGGYPDYALRFFEERGIVVEAAEGDHEALAAHTAVFVCFSYYLTQVCPVESVAAGEQGGGDTFQSPLFEANPWGWAIDPVGLRWTLDVYQARYHKPLYVVEDGCGHLEEPG